MARAPIRRRLSGVRNVRFSSRSWTNLGFSTRRSLLSSLTCVGRKKATRAVQTGLFSSMVTAYVRQTSLAATQKAMLPPQLIPNSTHLSLYGTPGCYIASMKRDSRAVKVIIDSRFSFFAIFRLKIPKRLVNNVVHYCYAN